MRKSLAAVITFSGLWAQAHQSSQSYEEWAKLSCAQIAKTYQSCSKPFEYKDETFYFHKLGRSAPCSDGTQKKFYDRLENMDMASILSIQYVTGQTPLPETRQNQDPGRLRSEDLLKSVYGVDEAAVRGALVKVNLLGHEVKFHRKLGAANALAQVGRELDAALKKDATLAEFLKNMIVGESERPSTMNWRLIAGTTRLSTHSFGTAVDLVVKSVKAQYWLWDEQATNKAKAAQGEIAYKDTHFIPAKTPYMHPTVVKIFEQNGFIWGGKWNHYDTMHFEYRPEFFPKYQIKCAQ